MTMLDDAIRRSRFAPKEQPVVSRREFERVRDKLEQQVTALEARLVLVERRPINVVSVLTPPDPEPQPPSGFLVVDIKRAACLFYGINHQEFVRPNRKMSIMNARHVALYLSCIHTHASLQQIGRHFGGLDHSTVYNARNRIAGLLTRDEQFVGEVAAIRRKLGIPEYVEPESDTPA